MPKAMPRSMLSSCSTWNLPSLACGHDESEAPNQSPVDRTQCLDRRNTKFNGKRNQIRRRATYAEESVERAVLHVLGDDHDGIGFGDDALQVDDVGVLELAHDGRLGQEVDARLVRTARFQRLDGHQHLGPRRQLQVAAAHVAELAATFLGTNETTR